jgi:hypothetical protein
MNWGGYIVAVLSLSLCVYGVDKCLRGFRRTRGSGTAKPYFYLLGMVPLLAIIALVLLVAFVLFFGPLH